MRLSNLNRDVSVLTNSQSRCYMSVSLFNTHLNAIFHINLLPHQTVYFHWSLSWASTWDSQKSSYLPWHNSTSIPSMRFHIHHLTHLADTSNKYILLHSGRTTATFATNVSWLLARGCQTSHSGGLKQMDISYEQFMWLLVKDIVGIQWAIQNNISIVQTTTVIWIFCT